MWYKLFVTDLWYTREVDADWFLQNVDLSLARFFAIFRELGDRDLCMRDKLGRAMRGACAQMGGLLNDYTVMCDELNNPPLDVDKNNVILDMWLDIAHVGLRVRIRMARFRPSITSDPLEAKARVK